MTGPMGGTEMARTNDGRRTFLPGVELARIDVGQALPAVVGAIARDWRRWVPIAAIVGLVGVLFPEAPVGDTDWEALADGLSRGDEMAVQRALEVIAGALRGTFLVSIPVSTVATWLFTGRAIELVRGAPMPLGRIVRGGILSVVAAILVGLAVAFVIGIIILMGLFAAAASDAPDGAIVIALVGVLVAFVFIGYGSLRLVFVSYALFEGSSLPESFGVSWRASHGGVWRIIGWGFISNVLATLLGVVVGASLLPLASAVASPLGDFVVGATSAVASLFTAWWLAVLYASQRDRHELPPIRPERLDGPGAGSRPTDEGRVEPPPDRFDRPRPGGDDVEPGEGI